MTPREKLELLKSYRAAGGTGSYASLLKEAKEYSNGGPKKNNPPTELSGPTIRGKKYPKGTIVTNDPNDPRLQPYRDSLLIHNAGEEAYQDFMQSLSSLGISNTSWTRIKNKYNSSDVVNSINRLERLNNKALSFDKQSPEVKVWKDAVGIGVGRIGVLSKPIQPVVYQDEIKRIKPKELPTPTISPNERVMPDVIYGDNDVPNAAYNAGMDITHYTDPMGRWAAKMNMSTVPGIRGRISTPNPAGNYTIKYDK